MATKYDLPNQFVSELQEYQTLFMLAANKTNSGNLSFTSTSSGVTYNSTTGQQGIFDTLQTTLADYLISANDWNNFSTNVENAVNQINSSLEILALGGLPYVN